ncbi:MAG TPA: hypothetical protein VGE09_06400 [Pseudoxanthomonas sp.]
MNVVNEPDYAPGAIAVGGGGLLLLVLGAYAFVVWLLFWGPARDWADRNKGGAALLLWGGPLAIVFLGIALLGALGMSLR